MKKPIPFIFLLVLSICASCSFAQSPDWLWAKGAGGSNVDFTSQLACDKNGNVYLAGYFDDDTITFGNITLLNAGFFDMFLVKYDGNGHVVWARSAGNDDRDFANGLTIDENGNVYVIGFFDSDSISFGAITLNNQGQSDMFIVKYDAAGNVVWARSEGGHDNDAGYRVTSDGNGNVYCSGYYSSDSISIGSETFYNSGNRDLFVIKYDANGTVLWAKSHGGNDDDYGSGITTDSSGNVYLTGPFLSDSISFGNKTLQLQNYCDLFFVKFASDGSILWANTAVAGVDDLYGGAVTYHNGNIYLTCGVTDSTLSHFEFLLIKLSSAGSEVWRRSAGGESDDAGESVICDPQGNIYVCGTYASDSINFGSTVLTNASFLSDIFITKYDPSGNLLWAKSAGGAGTDYGNSISIDGSGIYLAGSFDGSPITFGSTTLSNAGDPDVYIAKLSHFFSGISQLNESDAVNVFPNPANGFITIQTTSNPSGSTFRISDATGREVLTGELTSNITDIDISRLEAGIYFLQLSCVSNRSLKVVKQ